MRRELPRHERDVRTPLDVVRYYWIAVAWFGITPCIMGVIFFHVSLGWRALFAYPLGICAGLLFSWLVVYLESQGWIEIGP